MQVIDVVDLAALHWVGKYPALKHRRLGRPEIPFSIYLFYVESRDTLVPAWDQSTTHDAFRCWTQHIRTQQFMQVVSHCFPGELNWTTEVQAQVHVAYSDSPGRCNCNIQVVATNAGERVQKTHWKRTPINALYMWPSLSTARLLVGNPNRSEPALITARNAAVYSFEVHFTVIQAPTYNILPYVYSIWAILRRHRCTSNVRETTREWEPAALSKGYILDSFHLLLLPKGGLDSTWPEVLGAPSVQVQRTGGARCTEPPIRGLRVTELSSYPTPVYLNQNPCVDRYKIPYQLVRVIAVQYVSIISNELTFSFELNNF